MQSYFEKFVCAVLCASTLLTAACGQPSHEAADHSEAVEAPAEKLWQTYPGSGGALAGKKIVLVSGDEEYRSEEGLTQLGKILALHHGATAVVLYAQDPAEPGQINPNYVHNIEGLAELRDADLMVLATRFRALPDEQMQEFEAYLMSGRPVVGLRTATHPFKFPEDSHWAHWSAEYDGDLEGWHLGLGKIVMGETWYAHHGWHKRESTRGVAAEFDTDSASAAILNGIGAGEVWGPTDVYGVRPLPDDTVVVMYGEVLAGMDFDDPPIGPGPYEKVPKYGNEPDFHKNDPLMPLAWTKSYQLPGGKQGNAFVTTMGAAIDLAAEGTRRLVVNGVLWALGASIPESGGNVDIVGEFEPSMYGFESDEYWQTLNLRVSDLDL